MILDEFLKSNILDRQEMPTLRQKSIRGRKKILIDIEKAKKLCGLCSTGEKIAEFLGISYDTLEKRIREYGYTNFAEFYRLNLLVTKIKVDKYQWEVAMGRVTGDAQMLIWLGKQYLGQREPGKVEDIPVIDQALRDKQIKFINDNSKVLKQLTQKLEAENPAVRVKLVAG